MFERNKVVDIIVRILNRIRLKANVYSRNIKEVDYKGKTSFSFMTVEDIIDLRNSFPDELSEKKAGILKNRLNEIDKKVFKALRNGKMVGYFCISLEDTFENGVKQFIKVDDEIVYLFDDYVFLKYRGSGIHKDSIAYRNYYCGSIGKKKSCVCIYSTNKKSINNYQKLGYEYKYSLKKWFPVW